jgi:hypothetical protein
LSAQERKNGIAAKMTVIPLEAGDIRFDARFLQYENINFNIPALQINVTPQNASKINSQNINDSKIQLDDSFSADNINFNEIADSSGDYANKRILKRRFLFGFSIFVIILVIITPFVCLALFVRKK